MRKRIFQDLGRRSLSAFLALVMLISVIQIGAFAADPNQAALDLQEEKQIVSAGETAFYDKEGNPVSALGSSGVKVTRTLSPTGTENLFQIGLEVVTTQDLQEISVSPDAAVVLVMDVSNSMVGNDAKETINGVTKERLDWAKDAAVTFLSNYVKDADAAKRMVSIVEFGSSAHTVLNWTDANSRTTDAANNTVVATAVTTGVSAVSNGFTYLDCTTAGEHTHGEEVSYIRRASPGDWDHSTCQVCGVQFNGKNFQHLHCTYEGCTTSQDTEHTHTVTSTYTGPHGSHTDSGGTNIEGGLMLARNLILAGQQSGGAIAGMENLYVILLTDGSPTYYVSTDNTSATETYIIRGSAGCKNAPGGNCNNSNDYTDVPGLAADIKNAAGASKPIQYGAKLYSMVYGGKNSNGDDLKVNGALIGTWLTDTVKVDHNYPSSTGGDIATNLANIGALIGTLTQAWMVNDPIPTGGIVTFANSNLNSSGGPFSCANSSYVHYWDSANNQVVWDLKQETPTVNGSRYTYSLSYQVILNTEHSDFVAQQAYPTNGQAQLKYLILDASEKLENLTAQQVAERMRLANFSIPTVQGYEGQFSFSKIAHHRDEQGSAIPLGGAPFQMTNLANTPVEQSAGTINLSTTSQIKADGQTEGLVAFASIPSGFSYTMTEGPATEFTYEGRTYETVDTAWYLSVAYGEVTLSPALSNHQVENTLKQIPTTLDITKVWQIPNGANTQAITVTLLQDGQEFATLNLNGASATSSNSAVSITSKSASATRWVYTVTVPSVNRETGGIYTYTVSEQSLGDGYRTEYGQDGLSITNTTTGKTSVSVAKNWLPIDGADVSDNMPAVEVTLKRTSENLTTPATAGTATLSAANNWSYTFTDLEQYDSLGKPYTYSVSEAQGTYQQVGAVTGDGSQSNPFLLTNTVLEGSISRTVTKTWKDGGISAHRPNSIAVTLLRDNEVYASYSLSAAEGWSHTFTGLPQYGFTTDTSGTITAVHEYTYTVAELTQVEGYTSIRDGGLNLINTRAETVCVNVEKVWADSFPNHDEVTILLLRNGAEAARQVTVSGEASFTGLDRFDSSGVEYSYTIQEADVPAGYTPSYDYGSDSTHVVFANQVGCASVTNTLNTSSDTTSVTVNKVWQHPAGTTAPSVTFTLTQVDEVGRETTYDTFTMPAGTTTHTFPNLPLYYYEQVEVEKPTGDTDPETGKPIMTTETQVVERSYTYTVSEGAVDHYDSSSARSGNTWTFTNTITGTISDLSVEKVWVDLGENRPTAAFTLLRTDGAVKDGELVYEQVATWSTASNQSHNWGALPRYNAQGQLYTYKVAEGSVAGYSTSCSVASGVYSDTVKHITFTNTLNQDSTGSYTATKTWQDDSNAQNTRQAITLELLRDSVSLGTLVIRADGTMSSTGTYPGAASVTVNGNVWTVSFTGLEQYSIGPSSVSRYTYSVREVGAPEGYLSRQNGSAVVNTLAQDTTCVALTKNWVDPADTAHPNVTFVLSAATASGTSVTSAGGATFPKTLVLGLNGTATAPVDGQGNAIDSATADTWYYTWENLPRYTDSQQLITYTVTEHPVAGYTSEKSNTGNVFTNTIAQDALTISGSKVWDMSARQEDDVIRPDVKPVTVALYLVNGASLSLVEQEGLTNPVQLNADDQLTAAFSFENLPRYNLTTGDALVYTVREVEVTTARDGSLGYSPIQDNGTIRFEGEGQYTVTYGDDGLITNTYSDPDLYFYNVVADYTAYFGSHHQQIYSAQNVTVVDVTQLTSPARITVDPDDYTTGPSGDAFCFLSSISNEDGVPVPVETTVEVDQLNKLVTLHLYYTLNLYQLDVEYIFADHSTHSGYDAWAAPLLGDADPSGNYVIPDRYRGDDPFSGTYEAPPAGYEVAQVTLKDSEADARTVENTFNGGAFDDHDVKVVYVYSRVVSDQPHVTDPGFTILKVDSESGNLITHDAARFQLYSDEDCTTPVEGKVFSTVNGLATIQASDLGEGAWYLKEVTSPMGYTSGDTVWQVLVTYSEDQRLNGDRFINYKTWTLDVTLPGQDTSPLTDGNLVVPNQPETLDITAEKVWKNGREQAVTLRLLADGTPVARLTLDGQPDDFETEAWKGVFSGVFYRYSNGKRIDYTLEEDSLGSRWRSTFSRDASDGGYHFTVVNSYHSPSTRYYTVTVNYYDKQTGAEIAQSHVSDSIRSGSSYDVTRYDAVPMEGYTYDSTTGDPTTGTMNGDKVVDVWYTPVDDDGEEPPSIDPPKEEPPEEEPPRPDIPKVEVPKTGDELNFWIAAAITSAMGLAVLTVTGKKGKGKDAP